MSEHSLLHGWRTRAFHLSRNRTFLLRTSFAIVAVAYLAAAVIVRLRGGDDMAAMVHELMAGGHQKVHDEYNRLRQASAAEPRAAADWLVAVASEATGTTSSGAVKDPVQAFLQEGLVAGYDARLILDKHVHGETLGDDFMVAFLGGSNAEAKAARERLAQAAAKTPPPALANQLRAALVMESRPDAESEALALLIREGQFHPDAAGVRAEAARIAVALHDRASLALMASEPGWIESAEPLIQHRAGVELQDVWMLWGGLLRYRLSSVPWRILVLALLSGVVWFSILAQHGRRSGWACLHYVWPVMAGMTAVWGALALLAWQEPTGGDAGEESPPRQLIRHYLLGIGLREEGCKLLVFMPFLPWLLSRKEPGLALLTGGFVGLGFSVEENIQYFQDYGSVVAWSRFVSANFLHVALTGMAGHSLYLMFRSRFARVEPFLGTLAFVVVMHAAYDWLGRSNVLDVGSWLSIAVLLFIASQFIDQLSEETDSRRHPISQRAVFALGSACMIALTLLMTATAAQDSSALSQIGQNCLAIVPVAILYWRKFEHA